MLTFETLRKILNEEKISQKLVTLPEDFFEEVKAYFKNKKKMDSDFELESAMSLFQSILDLREKKILTLALYFVRSGIIPGNLTNEEKDFFNNIVKDIKHFQQKKKQILVDKDEKKILVAITTPIPKFVGLNMKNYGPFRKSDIVTLPEDSAKLLISKGVAREMKIEKPKTNNNIVENRIA